MRKSWTIRKDLEGVSPVIGTILMVAITVVLAAVLYSIVAIPPTGQDNSMVGFVVRPTGNNWTLTVSTVQGQVSLDGTSLTLKDGNGVAMYPLSAVPLAELTAEKWATYKVLYQKQKPGDTSVTAGSSILIDRITYPQGCSYVLTGPNKIVATGVL